jgi:hypothetical protein
VVEQRTCVDAIELEFGIDVLLLDLLVGRHVDRLGSHLCGVWVLEEWEGCSQSNNKTKVAANGVSRGNGAVGGMEQRGARY